MGVEKNFRAIHRRRETSFRRIRHASEARRPAIFAPSTHPIEALVVPAAVGHIRRTYPVTPAVVGDGDGEGGVLSGARTGFDTGREKASFRDGRVGRGGRRGSRRTWRRASRYATASESKGSRGLARARPSGVVARRDVSACSIGAEGRSRVPFRHRRKARRKVRDYVSSRHDEKNIRSPDRATHVRILGRENILRSRASRFDMMNTRFYTVRNSELIIPHDLEC